MTQPKTRENIYWKRRSFTLHSKSETLFPIDGNQVQTLQFCSEDETSRKSLIVSLNWMKFKTQLKDVLKNNVAGIKLIPIIPNTSVQKFNQ